MPTADTMNSPDRVLTGSRCGDVALAVNPFVANRYHFGMLLGVADLEAEQAYHRGKSWLHNAWLHGEGTVWGLRVELDEGELAVRPGLALDRHGRELYVADTLCLDLARWYVERRPDDLEVEEHEDGDLTFTVHVRLCHDSCLDRPVPSISEPCDDANSDTSYSRAVERGLPSLAAGPAPTEPQPWYPRLREFFGQRPAADPLVVEALAEVAAAQPADRPAVCVGWFRRLVAEDTMDLGPEPGAERWSPSAGDGCIALAQLAVRLRPDGEGFTVVADGEDATTVDNQVRPSHVRTRAIQELLCHGRGSAAGAEGGAPEEPAPEEPEPAEPEPDHPAPEEPAPEEPAPEEPGGVAPQAVSAELAGRELTVTFTQPLDDATVTAEAFRVGTLRSDGWAETEIRRAELDEAGTVVTLRLVGAPRVERVRVVATGSGISPLLGVDGLPLAGVVGAPPVPGGSDAALMVSRAPDPEPDPEPDPDAADTDPSDNE